MAIDKIFNDANVDGIADNIFGAVNNSVSEVKQMQQRKAAENVQMVVEAFKKIETNITEKFDNVTDVIEKRVLTIKDGRDGSSGSDGRNGRDGKPGRDGVNGKQGTPGTPGKDGADGVDGVSVTDASIDFDGSLVISLSSGQQINVGEVVPPELERQLVELRQGGGASAGSSGDVVGPASSTDNAIVRFDGTTGKLVQNSVVTIADTTGNMAGVGTLGVGAITTTGALVGAATQSAFNTVSTTLNVGGAATAVNIGAATGTLTVANTTLAAKRITASTTLAVTGVSTLTAGAVIQGMTVGLGSGSVATNTAVGFGALLFNINGIFNSALGYEALRYTTTGYSNTATGNAALHENISGYGNTASGSSALYYNTLGDSNVATGASSLQYNISGSSNTVSGAAAMQSNATGSRNTAIGAQALITYTPPIVSAGAFVSATSYTILTVGTTNFVAIGASANTVGVVFTATGAGSGTGTASTNVDATNTAIGYGAGSTITTGTKNTIIGAYSGNQGSLDIRTASNYIVLSDGDGNPRAYWNGAAATFGGALTVTGATTLSSTLSLGGTVSGGGNQINNVVIGTSTPLAGAFTTLTTSSTVTVNGGTANGVAFLNASKVLTTGTVLTFDGTRLGIGSAANTEGMLTVGTGTITDKNGIVLYRGAASSVSATQAAIFNELNGIGAGESLTLRSPAGFKFQNNDGTTEQARLSSTGLAVTGALSATGTLSGGTSGTGYSFSGSAPATSLTLDSSGNLGIGTNSPGGRLEVVGASQILQRYTGSATGFSIGQYNSSGDASINNGANADLLFATNNTERARISSAGTLLLTCTSTPSSTVSGLQLIGTGGGNISSSGSSTSTYNHWIFKNGNDTVGSISTNGSVTTYATSSDYRLKDNIAPMSGALVKVAALKPVTYKWKADGSDGEGFIAHELAEVVPQCVTGEKDAVNEDGSIKSQGIDTSFLVAILTAAMQEQQALITQLTARVAQLESKS